MFYVIDVFYAVSSLGKDPLQRIENESATAFCIPATRGYQWVTTLCLYF